MGLIMKNIIVNCSLLFIILFTFYMIASFSDDVDDYRKVISVQWCKKNITGVYYPSDRISSYYGIYVYAEESGAGDIDITVKDVNNRRKDIWQVHRISGSTKIATEPDMDNAMKNWGSIICKNYGAYIGISHLHIPYVFRN